jgi:hypothetical protein
LSADLIPNEVQLFLTQEVRSLLALEMLLLLRADPARSWVVADITRELRAHADWADQELAKLAERRLVERTPESSGAAAYRYAQPAALPAGAEFAVGWLAGAYPPRRFSIIQALYAQTKQDPAKPTAGPLGHFADAFVIR